MSIEDLLLYDGLIGLAGAEAPLTFLLKADFNGPDIAAGSVPASLDAPWVSEGGPLTMVQNDGQFSISGNRLVIPAQSTPTWGDLYLRGPAQSRLPGLGCFVDLLPQSGAIGWVGYSYQSTPTNPAVGSGNFYFLSGYLTSEYNPTIDIYSDGIAYKCLSVLRKQGAYLFGNGKLLWIFPDENGTVYPTIANYTKVFQVDSLRVADLPANGYGVFDHRDLDVTYSKASPAHGDTWQHTPDVLFTFTVTTLPSSGALNCVFRDDGAYASSNKNWLISIESGGNLRLYEGTGTGSNISRLNVGTVVNGSTVSVLAAGTTIKLFIDGVLKGTYSSATAWLTGAYGKWTSILNGAVVSNFAARTLDGVYTYPWESGELLVDGDMEAAGTSAWPQGNSCTVSKQTANPHGGSQVLRIARTTNPNSFVQQSAFTAGKTYRVHGWARSDGNAVPKVYNAGSVLLWTGTTSTLWQEFDVEFVAQYPQLSLFNFTSTGTQYVEYDGLSVIEVNPNRSTNHPGYGLATAVLPGPRAAGNTFTHEADCIIEFTLDALVAANNIAVLFRMQDATHTWHVVVDSAGNFDLGETNGSYSLKSRAAAVLSGGERIIVIASGETIKGFYNTTLAWTYSSATNFKTQTGGKVNSLGTGGRISNLVAWPLDLESAPNTGGAVDALEALTRMGE